MLGLKTKSAPKEAPGLVRRRKEKFVVVQYQPGADPELWVSRPWDYEACERIFNRTLVEAEGAFRPDRALRLRVMSVREWTKSRTATALLES